VFFSVMTGSMNFGIASPYIETFGLAQAAAAKIYSIIDNIPVINKSKGVGDRPEKIEGNIVFQDVHFHYPSRATVQILNGLNLTIKAGETVALVGSSGCGKSTCLQLIQRFYDPLSGSVSLDGKNLKNLDLEWLRQHIGVVSQEPVLFATTIGENIRYGYKSATQEDIERAAVKANAHSFIKNLPDGYNTIVGERGAQLSGGQKQRIAIARALVRDPSILLLDEATSALDTNSEAKVQAALDMASKERTTIIVAHRLSTIRGANKIVVISKGQVVEQGTHDELMALKQEYFSLVTTQVTSDDIDRKPDAALSTVDFDEDIDQTVTPKGVNVEEEQSTPAEMASLWTVMKMNASEWWQIFVGCISSLIMGGAMPIFAVLFGEIIGVAEEEDVVREETNKYSLYFVITGIVVGTATFFQIYMFGIAGERLTMRLRIEMFRAMLAQEMGWYDKPKNGVGALCARLSGDAAHVQGATGQRVGTVLQSVATIGLAVGLSMYYEWRLGLLALAFTPFILLATFGEQRLMNVENQSQSETLQKSIKLAVEAVSNVRTVVSLGIEKSSNEEYVNKLNPHFKRTKRNTHFRAFVLGLARSLMFFAFSACMYYGGILIRDDGIAYSDVFKVSQALIMGTVSIANALAFAPNFRKGLTAVHKVLKLINRQPRVADAPGAIDKTWNSAAIDYSEVYFSYPTRLLTTVLKGLDLSILEGQTVALVGPSGCGKSTVIQLLERFYDPTDGKIEVDKTDTKQITLSSLRRQLGIVSQEPILFDRTIAENIAYGDNSREILADEIVEAARKANIHNFVTGLPLGYETRLGEKGTQLSGGQKQRVAIARALVRNPKVLLLDEATSALDTESEKIVQEALDKAKVGRTCIIIAHRLSTIQDADVICVINDGKVAEMGTHSDLLALKGLYHRLHTVQDRK
ncbi:ABC subfamily B member 5, partial [Rhyzopertha dominica]